MKNPDSILNEHDQDFRRLEKKAQKGRIPEEFLREHDYFRSLLEITQSISKSQNFKLTLELIVDSAIDLTGAERGFLMLFDKAGNLEFKVMRGMDSKELDGEDFKISKTVVNHVMASGSPLFLGDISKDRKFKVSKSIETLGLRMVMCVPLKTKENLLGVIYVDARSEIESFTKLKERIFEAFAAQASLVIENSYLYDSSVHDALTGLFDYGYLRRRLEEEIIRASCYKKSCISFVMLDLDNFKYINDSYGHLFGNTILARVAGIIKDTVRKYDVAARYGGDEFAILMPETDIDEARDMAQRLQNKIVGLSFSAGKETIAITSSIGISTFPVEKIVDSEKIIIEADHALFVAKSKGKNEIAVFGLRKDEKKLGPEIIGLSEVLAGVREMIVKFARTDATLLITGETGTGKELVTKLVHQESGRADKPLVVVNCGAIPDNLLESELFGYEKGAFTGAYRQHKGKFELAQGGTILLDEIGELPLHLQVKILRTIEQKEIDRLGGKAPIKVDVRVIAATNKNLEEEVRRGNFRKDLFYRLSVVTIQLPPLRERPEDIEELSRYFLVQMNQRYQRKFLGFTRNALQALMHHIWPGNVRELIYRIERAVIMGRNQDLDENDLGLGLPIFKDVQTLKAMRNKAEKEGMSQALIRNRWNITHASKELGISQKTLRDLMKKHNIVKATI